MMSSMYSAVSGLAIHQTKMDVIGNNIANVNTVGFKSSSVVFSDIFSQTVQSATSSSEYTGGTNPMQIGLGASISSINVDMSEGSTQVTNNSLDLSISGDGFFVVSDATGNYFTRAGAFSVDEAGNLVTSSGMFVMGWGTDEDGEVQKGTVEAIQILSDDNLYSEPEMTTDCTISGNVNKDDDDLTDDGIPFTLQFYDSLGYLYTANFTVTEDTTSDTDNLYTFSLAENSIVDSTGAVGTDAGITNAAMTYSFEFDPDTGQILTSDPALDDEWSFTLDAPETSFSEFSDITVDFSSLTMYSSTSSIAGSRGDADGYGSGSAAGSLSDYEISSDGTVYGRYTNGDTVTFGQIVVANFDNPSGLSKQGDNLYATTVNSGDFDGIGEDITASGGSMTSGTLEMSNVDLSSEFTEMITTQRGFQANSRVITTSDEMLQELVNLK